MAVDLVAVLRDWSRAVRAMAGSRERVAVVCDRGVCPVQGDANALHAALRHLATSCLRRARTVRRHQPQIRLHLIADRLADGGEAVALAIASSDERAETELDQLARHLCPPGPEHDAGGEVAAADAIARAHGGEIRLTVTGTGTELRLVLPVGSADAEAGQPAGLRLLVVGGDRLSLEHTAQGLRELGAITESFATVAAALRALQAVGTVDDPVRKPFAAIIADAGLGGAALVRLVQAARANHANTRVVILDGRERGDGTPPGAIRGDLLLRKPCGAWDLIQAIRTLPLSGGTVVSEGTRP